MKFDTIFPKMTGGRPSLRPLLEKNHLGCHLDQNKLYAAHLTICPTSVSVDSLTSFALQDNVKPLDMMGQTMGGKIKNAVISSVFPSHKLLARPIELKSFVKSEVDSVLKYQLEPLLPYSLESSVSDKITLFQNQEKASFFLFAAKKDDVQSCLKDHLQYGIDPEIVAPKAIALAHFADLFCKETKNLIIIDLSADETSCLVLKEGMPHSIRSMPLAFVTDGSEEELKHFSLELSRILYSIESEDEEVKAFPILFTGHLETDPRVLSLLAQLLGHDTLSLENLPHNVLLKHNSIKECCSFAVPIGLSLISSPLQKEKFSINLRQEELSYSKKWRRYKNDLIFYFSCMIILSIAGSWIGGRLLDHRTVGLQESYARYVSLLEKAPSDIETLFTKQSAQAPKEIKELSAQDIKERLSFIQQTLVTGPDEMAFYPNVPRASDLLGWLASHPKAKSGNKSIQIEKFSYTLVKRPEKEKPKEHYQVRVDLELTAPSPEAAREFYEALLAPNPFVDTKYDVQWSMQKGVWQTSFFLKDKTQYPYL